MTTLELRDPVKALLQTAREFLGVREEPGNRGIVPDFANWWLGRDMRDYYPDRLGLKGAPWCSTWTNLVGRLGLGWLWPIPIGALYSDVDQMVNWAVRNKAWHTRPQVGDLFCVRAGGGYAHIGIVTVVGDDQIRTIEGNTNDDGSFNGNGVYERIRNPASCGFIRWLDVAVQHAA